MAAASYANTWGTLDGKSQRLSVGPHVGRDLADLVADPAYIKMRLDRIALLNLAEADKVKRDCSLK